jgi:regulator of PEP synthase PpsR (kinase-PPPase family)
MGAGELSYAQLEHVQRELRFCHEYYRTPPAWPMIDVTNKSIEEVAVAVCAVTVDLRQREA